MILYASLKLPERIENRGRGARDMTRAFTDVLRNPHGRLLFIVYGIQSFGTASIGLLAPYVMQYVVKAPNLTEVTGERLGSPCVYGLNLPNIP